MVEGVDKEGVMDDSFYEKVDWGKGGIFVIYKGNTRSGLLGDFR